MTTQNWFGHRVVKLFLVSAGFSLIILGTAILASTWIDDLVLSTISLLIEEPVGPDWIYTIHKFGGDALLSGALIAAFVWLGLPRKTLLTTSLTQKKHFLSAVATAILVVLWLPVGLIGHSATIAGEKYWWFTDDAMISMRYARNLANGVGLVWNPGERVEGYTNFLWTVYMALLSLFPMPDSKISLVVLLTNVALSIAIVPVLIQLVRLLGGGTLAMVTTLAGYVLSRDAMAWGTDGLEPVLLTFLFLVATCRLLQEGDTNRPRLLTYLLVATLPLVRTDAVTLSALLYAISLLITKNKKAVLIYSATSLLLPTAHEVFRIYYYGDILPNTAYLKATNWDNRYVSGLRYVLAFVKDYAILMVFAVVGVIVSRERSQYALLAAFLLYTAYVTYVGGDAFGNFRFFIPVLPLLMVLAFAGIQKLPIRPSRKLAVSLLCLVLGIPLIVPGYSSSVYPQYNYWPNSYTTFSGNIRIGLLLKHNTPATSKVADFWAGSVPYYSERYAIDLLGKSDHYIARLPAVSGTFPGHNKFDFSYSLGVLKPDFVVANFKLPEQEDEMGQGTLGDYTERLYFDPIFREHCLPNPVAIDTWRTIFVCDWSSQVEKKNDWEELPLDYTKPDNLQRL